MEEWKRKDIYVVKEVYPTYIVTNYNNILDRKGLFSAKDSKDVRVGDIIQKTVISKKNKFSLNVNYKIVKRISRRNNM